MSKKIFVSDVNQIIDLIFSNNFYNSYNELYYKDEDTLYGTGTMKDDLKMNGYELRCDEIKYIEQLVQDYLLEGKVNAHDLLLFLDLFKFDYEYAKRNKLDEVGENEVEFTKELLQLDTAFNQDLVRHFSQLNSILFKFNQYSTIKSLKISSYKLRWIIINSIVGYLKSQKHHIEFLKFPDSKDRYFELVLAYGKKSLKKDNFKTIVRRKSCHLLREYFTYIGLFGMTNNVKITNKGAEFIGMMLVNCNLIEVKEDEFESYQDQLDTVYTSYKNFLIQIVKSYFS